MTNIRSIRRTSVALLAFAILSVVVVETPAGATPGSSDRDWNLIASNALFTGRPDPRPAGGWHHRRSCIWGWFRGLSTTR